MPPDGNDGLDDSDLPGLHDDLASPTPNEPVTPEASGPDWEAIDKSLHEWQSDLDTKAKQGEAGHEELDEWFKTVHDSLVGDDLGEFTLDIVPWDRKSLEEKASLRRFWEDQQKRTPRPRWVFIAGGFGILGLVLGVGFFLFGGDADDGAVALPSEVPVEKTAPPSTEPVVADTEAPAVAVDEPEAVVEDEPATELVAVPEVRTIDVEGEQVDVTLWRAQTATHVLVAAPSLNSDLDDLAVLAANISGQDCASVVAFDSSLASPDAPIFSAIIDDWLDGFGFDSDAAFSTLGSSATAADALIAADLFGAQDVYLFSPSDPPPFNWEELSPRVGIDGLTPHVVVRITEGDLQYRPLFDQWIAAGYEAYVVDGRSHGTAFFNEAAAEPVLEEVADHICHFVHD